MFHHSLKSDVRMHWLFFLRSGVWDDDQLVDSQVDQQRSRSGVEDSAGQQLVRQVYREQVRLTGTRQPATNDGEALEEEVTRGRWGARFGDGQYLILSVTPWGTPTLTVADRTLCRLIFLSAPYSTTVPNQPVLQREQKHTVSFRERQHKSRYKLWLQQLVDLIDVVDDINLWTWKLTVDKSCYVTFWAYARLYTEILKFAMVPVCTLRAMISIWLPWVGVRTLTNLLRFRSRQYGMFVSFSGSTDFSETRAN